MEFSSSFTGKGVTTKLDNTGSQEAQQGLAKIIKEANDLKFKVYQKNRDEFLKNSNIDPEFIFSTAARELVQKEISEFNTTYGKLAKKYNYNLPDDIRMEMQNKKNLILAEQQNQTAQYEMWKQHRALVANKPDMFDDAQFAEATKKYMETGSYGLTMPPIRAISPASYLAEEAGKLKGEWSEKPIMDKYGQVSTETYGLDLNDPKQVYGFYKSRYESAGIQEKMGFVQDWDKFADKEKYLKMADENNDGVADPREKDNAIILWAKDYYRPVVEPNLRRLESFSGAGKTGSSNTIQPVDVGGSPVKMSVGKQNPNAPKSFGETTYIKDEKTGKDVVDTTARTYSQKSFHFGGTATIGGIPTRGGIALNPDGTETELPSGVISGVIRLYDPVKKVFLIESTSPSSSTDQTSRTLFEIPEQNIDNFGNIPVSVDGQPEIKNISDYNNYWSSSATPRNESINGSESKWSKYKR